MEWRDRELLDDAGAQLARIAAGDDGRRWRAWVQGEPVTIAGTRTAGARLCTWETADGARAGVLRELRRRSIGESALRAFFREQHARLAGENDGDEG